MILFEDTLISCQRFSIGVGYESTAEFCGITAGDFAVVALIDRQCWLIAVVTQ